MPFSLMPVGPIFETGAITVRFGSAAQFECPFWNSSVILCKSPQFNFIGTVDVSFSVDTHDHVSRFFTLETVPFIIYPPFDDSFLTSTVLMQDRLSSTASVELLVHNLSFIGTNELRFLFSTEASEFDSNYTSVLAHQPANYIRSYEFYRANYVIDVQVLVLLDSATLISQGKLLNSCQNLRVRSENMTQDLVHWLDPATCNSAQSTVWIRLPKGPPGALLVHLVYGDPLWTSLGDAASVFHFYHTFDHFDFSRWIYPYRSWVDAAFPRPIDLIGGLLSFFPRPPNQVAMHSTKSFSLPLVFELRFQHDWSLCSNHFVYFAEVSAI